MKKKSGIFRFLAQTTIFPIILLCICFCIFGILCISFVVSKDVQNELQHLADAAASSFDRLYPGDYAMYTGDNEILVTKGDTILNGNYAYIDAIKEETDMDFSLFYQDMRVITTLRNSEGQRMIGSQANPQIVEAVIQNKTNAFYRNVDIFGSRYYCYYKPLFNSDGTCVGMFAAIVPATRLYQHILHTILPMFLLMFVIGLFAYFWSYRRSLQLTSVTQQLSCSLDKVANGSLSNTVTPNLLARRDEFGEIAHSIVDMQASLRNLIERDALTGLYNRRFGQKRLSTAFEKAENTNTSLTVALGDIDFFKRFNDTYGHDCGDFVLCNTAQMLMDHIKDYGFCCRWGGEEFLILLTKGSYEEHHALLSSLISVIASNQSTYEGQSLSVTMTFGMIDTACCTTVDDILRTVDELLYEGKEAGRNRLIASSVGNDSAST